MITIKQIEVYKKYDGDGDGFIRCATQEEKIIMDYEHWSLIEDFIQNLTLEKKGLASNYLIESTNGKMKDMCENQFTIQALKDLI